MAVNGFGHHAAYGPEGVHLVLHLDGACGELTALPLKLQPVALALNLLFHEAYYGNTVLVPIQYAHGTEHKQHHRRYCHNAHVTDFGTHLLGLHGLIEGLYVACLFSHQDFGAHVIKAQRVGKFGITLVIRGCLHRLMQGHKAIGKAKATLRTPFHKPVFFGISKRRREQCGGLTVTLAAVMPRTEIDAGKRTHMRNVDT